MSQVYIEYAFTVAPKQPAVDILIAELGEIGFESFVEQEDGLLAYVQEDLWDAAALKDLYVLSSGEFDISYKHTKIEQVNWNEEWEKNFHPITVDDRCTVRAPFHAVPETTFDIVIEPKMSFGTGHHETTFMMLKLLLDMDLEGKDVLDMGCGTGVLAILACKKGASYVEAIDIDNWCYLNSVENAERNDCEKIKVFEGDVSLLKEKKFDVIIANINRNILLEDIPAYAACLNKDGVLLLSGFYRDDIPVIREKCEDDTLKFVENLEKNLWVALKFLN
ncbi:50S ribosomal protein L11 methyltransferase [Robertkochia solimangrovi]|uniref:50S ribosomal protein L11 methyltransferase n=1 Tax=Robertkochia solimangrovi TaxID=2213046 RepID=UPI00117E6256|nr:50S ribosomal protein L11 methyltransferase [Robertkochia solimangrovi]TRZ41687.1 50S ribosomal protein L11 methyltransferase [Robertkochia solimangrovi]